MPLFTRSTAPLGALYLSHPDGDTKFAQGVSPGSDHVDVFGRESRRVAAGRMSANARLPTALIVTNHCTRNHASFTLNQKNAVPIKKPPGANRAVSG